jgi:hypothetical protein
MPPNGFLGLVTNGVPYGRDHVDDSLDLCMGRG